MVMNCLAEVLLYCKTVEKDKLVVISRERSKKQECVSFYQTPRKRYFAYMEK